MIDIIKSNLENDKKEFLSKIGSYDGWEVPWAWPKHHSRPNGGYPANSIYFCEAFALYKLAKQFKIDTFIESGVYRGGSTSLWGRTLTDIQIYSVDYVKEGSNPRQKWEGVKSTLAPLYPNINFIEGDGNLILPNLIEKNSDKKIGVFVDGPKDSIGLKLAEKCLSYDNVFFSSLHDFTSSKYFNTHIEEYKNLVNDMDKTHPQIEKYPFGPGLTILTK